jgi:ribosomal protein L11 methyltransferase
VAVHVPRAELEVARARLLELCPEGFEEVDRGDGIELAVYTDPAGESALRAAFVGAVASAVDPGWEERWREFHRSARAAGLWIGPPWLEAPERGDSVVIDPGRAFGTGAHATTRATIELLGRQPRGSLLDAGCGSGVVSIAAVRLGFGPVVAVDVDTVAVEVARENAHRNDVDVDARRLDVLHDELPDADVLVANIELATVEALLARTRAGIAIASGYLVGEAPAVAGWTVVDSRELEGWSAHALRSWRRRKVPRPGGH